MKNIDISESSQKANRRKRLPERNTPRVEPEIKRKSRLYMRWDSFMKLFAAMADASSTMEVMTTNRFVYLVMSRLRPMPRARR